MITPRFSGAVNKDNTDRIIKRDYQSPAFASTIAIAVKPTCAYTLVQPVALTGAVTFSVNVGDASNPPMVDDRLNFLFTNDGSTRVVTFGTGFLPTGTLSVTGAKTAYAAFVFNGSAWQQTGSSVTA